MPNKNGKTNRKQRKGGKRRVNASKETVDLAMAGTRSYDHVIYSDLTYKPMSPFYNSRPPRNLGNQVHFIRCVTTTQFTTNTTTIMENNIQFTAASHMPQFTSYLGVFDQYYLDTAIVTVANLNSNSGVAALPQIYTALDFDNIIALGSVAVISQYATCNSDDLAPGASVTRIIKPCIASSIQGGSLVSGGVQRTWVDNAFSSVIFYGFRSILQNTPPAALTLDVTINCTWAFRNNV
jgi:hypothetical protein